MNHGLILNVIAEPVLARPFLTEDVEQERAHALAPDVRAALRKLDRAPRREQVREVVPEILVEVIAVRARQVVDLVEVLRARDLLLGAGFSEVEVFFKWYNFVGIVAVK